MPGHDGVRGARSEVRKVTYWRHKRDRDVNHENSYQAVTRMRVENDRVLVKKRVTTL